MNTTYKRIWDDADRQWKYSKSFYQVQFLFPRAVMPSPMRILYYLVKHIHSCKRRQQKTTEKNKQAEIFKNYKQTLVEILSVKLTSDFEDTMEEDFKDLRQDIRNNITEKQKRNEETVLKQFQKLTDTIAEQRETELQNYNRIETMLSDINGLKEELNDVKDMLKSLLNEIRKE